MEDYDHADEAADSDPSETLCCKSHKQIDWWPKGSSGREQSLPHPDLAKIKVPIEQSKPPKFKNKKTKKKHKVIR